jgi:hypothetical protein
MDGMDLFFKSFKNIQLLPQSLFKPSNLYSSWGDSNIPRCVAGWVARVCGWGAVYSERASIPLLQPRGTWPPSWTRHGFIVHNSHMNLFTRYRSTIWLPEFYVALPFAGRVVEMSLFLFRFGPNPGLNLAFHLLRVKSRSSKQYLHLIFSNLLIPRFFSTYGKPVHEVILCLAGILSILLVGKGLGHVRLVTKLVAKV